MVKALLAIGLFLLATHAAASSCAVELIVLGAGQDAGAPQIGNPSDPAWADPALRLTATSVAIVDHAGGQRWLFEATPHVTEQLQRLDTLAPYPMPGRVPGLGIDGVFLTHAHIGHYAGLMFFGREAAGARGIPVYAMPRLVSYLESDGPWSQLVRLGNIALRPLQPHVKARISERLSVTPLPVPHRDEYSETVGFVIATPATKTLFLPDIDSWEDWTTQTGVSLLDRVRSLDHLFVDATFFNDSELPGRDMTQIPHPRVSDTMDQLASLPATEKRKVRFIHYNHTNPIRFPDSPESAQVREAGFGVARAGDRLCLQKDR